MTGSLKAMTQYTSFASASPWFVFQLVYYSDISSLQLTDKGKKVPLIPRLSKANPHLSKWEMGICANLKPI